MSDYCDSTQISSNLTSLYNASDNTKNSILDYSRDKLFDEAGIRRLSDSYMLPNEVSPQERFAFVSKQFASSPEHAKRLYEYSSKHWLSYSTPILSFGRTKKGLPISCLAGDTLINTGNDGLKPIKYIEKGDLVLTHKGRFREVVAKKASKSNNIYELDVLGAKIKITANHPVLTDLGWVKVEDLNPTVHLIATNHKLQKNFLLDNTYSEFNNGLIYHSITSLKKLDSPEIDVYDIQVKEDESFSATGILLHNCYLVLQDDSSEGLVNTMSEVAWLSMLGGGVGIHLGIRSADDKSTGVLPHLKVFDAETLAYRQSTVRRGSYAVFLDISHPDVKMFIDLRKSTGDPNIRCQNLHHGINITDKFMEIIEKCMDDHNVDDSWPLIDPHSKKVVEIVSAKELWQSILAQRLEKGEPYIVFIDKANECLPKWLKDKGLRINGSNLCCLTGDTEVLTKEYGACKIEDLVGKNVTIFDGINWVSNDKFELKGQSNKIYRIHIFDGSYIDCTANHRWFVASNYTDIAKNRYDEVLAKNLKMGDLIETHDVNFYGKTMWSYPDKEKNPWNKIILIEEINGDFPVYCTSIETTGKFALANGLMTGNSEIILPTSNDRTAVCCLSSVNLEYFDEWKDNNKFISDVMEMLDNVLDYFCKNAPDVLWRAKNSAENQRDVGLGVLGFHAYLQKKNIPFESALASSINRKIFDHIRKQVDTTNNELAIQRGEAPDAKGYGTRFSHTMAIAPNASSSTIMGNTSPSIEPYRANIFRQDTLSGALIVKNRFLDKKIKGICSQNENLDYQEIWSSIIANNGSIQHLDIFDGWTKDVFKTAMEIDQNWIIQHAADRQPYIDQSQSVNLFFSPEDNIKYIHDTHFLAWKKGLKTLYYLRASKVVRAENIGRKVEKYEGCLACE